MKPAIALPGPLRRLPLRRPDGSSAPLPGTPDRVLLELDLSRGLAEAPPGNPIEALRSMHTPLLRTLVEHLRRAGTDPEVVGLIATVGVGPGLTLSQSEELRDAVNVFRRTGKPTLAWASTFGEFSNGTVWYHLAAAFDEVWLQPSGDVGLIGFAAQSLHLRAALDKLDVEPQIHQRHEYKSAADLFMRREMSDPVREMLTRLVGSATETVVRDVARDRSMTEQGARALLDDAPLTAGQARDHGLIDHLGYRDEAYAAIRAKLAGADPDEPTLRFVERHHAGRLDAVLERVRSVSPRRPGTPGHGRPVIAVVQASGPILAGRPAGPFPGGGQVVTADRLGAVLRAAGRDRRVRAVVLRIDSPGGSYVASDAIRREVLRLRESGTEVIASMASVAASGGYYIAMGCRRILAGAGTVTGSIGVLAGKQTLARTLERIGVTQETVPGSRHADMFSAAVRFDEDQLALLDAWLDDVYADFTGKAASDRGMDVEDLRRVARGRVWSGADALDRGLIDAVGGLSQAVDAACEAAGLSRTECAVKAYPSPNPLQSLLPAKNSEDIGSTSSNLGGPGGLSGLSGLGLEGPTIWTAVLAHLAGVPAASGALAHHVAPVGLGVLSLPPVRLTGLLPEG